MVKKQRKYDMEYKIQAVKLAKEIGGAKAATKLGIPENIMYSWTKAAREGRLDAGPTRLAYATDGYESRRRTGSPAQAGQGAEKRNPPSERRNRIS